MKRDPRLRYAAYGALYFFWGTTFLAIRLAVQHGFPPFALSALRHGSAGLILFGLARGRGTALPTRREMLGAAAMGVCFLALANGTCAWAMRYVDSGYATLLIAGVPIVALAYGAKVQGKAVRKGEWRLVLLGLAGAAILLSPGAARGHSSAPVARLALVAATIIWAVTMAEKQRFPAPKDPLMLTAFQMAGGGTALLLVSAASEAQLWSSLPSLPLAAWWAWAYLVVFGSCVGYGAFSYLLSTDPPQLVGTYAYVNPVVAVIAGHYVLGERISGAILFSSALILISVAGLLLMEPHADEGEQP